MSARVLLLEDDPNLGTILNEHLNMQGFAVSLCTDGEAGLKAFRETRYDLCLVDIMMPKLDGFSFAREIRGSGSETPIIFLTAKSLKEDKIEGFRIGCDDYVTKPFSMEELLLRIQAVLKRTAKTQGKAETDQVFQIGQYSFDSRRQLLKIKDLQYKLTPKESELLKLLCLHMNRTLDREYALKNIWGDDSYFTSRSMDVFISRLRKYLKDDKKVEIMSIHGRGVRLIVG